MDVNSNRPGAGRADAGRLLEALVRAVNDPTDEHTAALTDAIAATRGIGAPDDAAFLGRAREALHALQARDTEAARARFDQATTDVVLRVTESTTPHPADRD